MEITKEMLNVFKFPKEVIELVLAPFMEMPTGEHPFVMQHHWRGRSVHVDWRMKTDGFLSGWTVLDNPKGTPKIVTVEEARKAMKSVPFVFKAVNKNQGKRAEPKARQPLDWLKVHGVTNPGDVGATKENIGVLLIFEKGSCIFGVQKPYFHEYFVKTSLGNFFPKGQWVRIVVRRVGVPVLDPETKKPLKKREAMWRVMVPGTQEPYCISKRAIRRGYKPPKTNRTPFPVAWTKKNFGEQYTKWEEYMKGKVEEKKSCRNCAGFETCKNPETLANPNRPACSIWGPIDLIKSFESLPFAGYKDFKDCVRKNRDKKNPSAYCAFVARQVGEIKTLSSSKFTLHFNSWMGQFVVRGVPKREWYLRLDDKGSGGVRSFFFPRDPLYYEPTSAEDEGRVDRKWLDFEGKIAPRTKYNPNKKIPASMKIVDKGSCIIDTEIRDGTEIISLKFKGKKLKGKWRLVQEEKKAPTYSFEKLNQELTNLTFVLQKHWIPLKKDSKFPDDFGQHMDIRFSNGTEFNLYKDPLKAEVDEEIKVKKKPCRNVNAWMAIKKDHTSMKVGPLLTYVDPIDGGKAEIYETSPTFMSMKFMGTKLKGYFVWKKTEEKQVFLKSRLPKVNGGGGRPNSQSNLSDQVLEETYQKILEQIQSKAKVDPAKDRLSLELKKKKLELIEKWLEAQGE